MNTKITSLKMCIQVFGTLCNISNSCWLVLIQHQILVLQYYYSKPHCIAVQLSGPCCNAEFSVEHIWFSNVEMSLFFLNLWFYSDGFFFCVSFVTSGAGVCRCVPENTQDPVQARMTWLINANDMYNASGWSIHF